MKKIDQYETVSTKVSLYYSALCWLTCTCVKPLFKTLSVIYFDIFQHYGQGKSELEAKVWYLTIVKQFPLYGCTLFPILHKGLWSHSHDALLAINMDGVKFVRAKDKKVLHDFKYGEIESIALDPNDNYVTMELKNDVAKDCPQRCFMFETNHKEDLGNLIASYSPVHSIWLKPDYEGVKKVIVCCFVSLYKYFSIFVYHNHL